MRSGLRERENAVTDGGSARKKQDMREGVGPDAHAPRRGIGHGGETREEQPPERLLRDGGNAAEPVGLGAGSGGGRKRGGERRRRGRRRSRGREAETTRTARAGAWLQGPGFRGHYS